MWKIYAKIIQKLKWNTRVRYFKTAFCQYAKKLGFLLVFFVCLFVCFVKSLINCIMLSVFRPGRLVEDDRSWLYSTDPWHMLLSLHSARLQQNLQRNVELFSYALFLWPCPQKLKSSRDSRTLELSHLTTISVSYPTMRCRKKNRVHASGSQNNYQTRSMESRTWEERGCEEEAAQCWEESSPETPARKARGLCVPWGKNSKGRTV